MTTNARRIALLWMHGESMFDLSLRYGVPLAYIERALRGVVLAYEEHRSRSKAAVIRPWAGGLTLSAIDIAMARESKPHAHYRQAPRRAAL